MPRRRVLTDAQITALFALPTAEPDLIRHYTLGPDDLAVIARRRRPHNRLGFALQLCALRYPGRLIRPGELVPRTVVAFLAEQLDIDPDALADYAARAPTRYDQVDALHEAFGFRTFSQPDHRELSAWLVPIALATVSAIAVAEALMAELRRRRVAAPGTTTVERMVAAALLQAERHAAAKLSGTLSPEKRAALDALLDNHPGTAVSSLAWARQSPGAPGHRSMARLIDQLRHLRQVGIAPAATDGIHADRVRQLVREGSRLTAQHLRALSPLRRHATLVVTVLDTITRLTDEAIGLFDRLIGRMFRRAERRASADLQTNARSLNDKVRLLAKLGDALIEARETGADAFAAVGTVIPWDRFAEVVAEAKGLTRDDGPDYLAVAEANHALLRRVGPLFLDAFEFQGIAAVTGLLRATTVLRTFYAGNRRTLPKDVPTGFIRRSWRSAVFRDGAIDGQAYELCLFAELRDRLRAGDVWVVGSRQYRAVEDQLISKPLFAEMRAAGPLPVAVPSDAARYLQGRKELLEARLREVCEKAAQDQLVDVRLSGDTLKISPLQAATPEEAERLADRVYARMPRVRITDLLDEVAEWTGAGDCFTHLRTGLPAEDRRVVLTAVLADATNLGLTRMAEACSVASYKQLAWTAGWHVSEDAYGRALARIVAAQQAQPLAAHFGNGTASSSDGQHFPLGGRGEVTGAVNPHKGSGPAATWPTLEPFIAGRIDEALIQAHWDDLLRLATSIRTGAVPASLMLKRLGSYPRQNGLALALREVGRLERTLFTLEWLQNPALRRQATAELNKGESRNGLARAVCFHRLGRIRDRTPENQQHRAGGLNLVVAAIILWNTVYMERAIDALRAGGERIPNELLSHLAPLGWQHINLTGDYLWSANRVPSTTGYRPLRAPTELLAA